MIDAAYISATAALVGAFVGGGTSIATSWLSQKYQTREQRIAREKDARQAVYTQFLNEASKLYVDALTHDSTELAKLVDIYATLNRIRIFSTAKVIEAADQALREIIDTYGKKDRTFAEIRQNIHTGFSDPLRQFSEECHRDLASLK